MKRIILGALLLLLPAPASASETRSLEQILAEYEAEVAVTLPSHWECVCGCQYADELGTIDLENPEGGDKLFYPGGGEAECPKMEGKACIGEASGTTLRGALVDCEWSLVPDAK